MHSGEAKSFLALPPGSSPHLPALLDAAIICLLLRPCCLSCMLHLLPNQMAIHRCMGRHSVPMQELAPSLAALHWLYMSLCLLCRALAAPAVLIMSVSQGACLGQQDAWTPFSVLAAAGLLNAGARGCARVRLPVHCCAALCSAVRCCADLCCAVLCCAVHSAASGMLGTHRWLPPSELTHRCTHYPTSATCSWRHLFDLSDGHGSGGRGHRHGRSAGARQLLPS